MPTCVTRVMCRASEVSFILSFKIMDVALPVDQEIARAIKHAGREKALANKGSHLGGKFGIIHHPRDDADTNLSVKSLMLCDM